MTSIENKQVT